MIPSLQHFDGLLWLLASLLLLTFLQRSLHREIQSAFLLLTRRPGVTQAIFALIFFPGVLLHELSHYLLAKLLRVPTGRISLLPQAQPDGRLRLGYVETGSGGMIRDAMIGFAPLASGCLFVACVAVFRMDLLPLWEIARAGQWQNLLHGLARLPESADFWLWFYLTFTISSTMMPSASDRHAWLPFGLLLVSILGAAFVAGAGPWLLANLAPPFNGFLRGMALIFALSGVLHLVLILPFWGMHRLLARFTRIDVAR
jgi:hypothetical protein